MLFASFWCFFLFFFNDTATTEIYTLSLHDALPISPRCRTLHWPGVCGRLRWLLFRALFRLRAGLVATVDGPVETKQVVRDRKSTRLNSSHANISYAVFCLKKNNTHMHARDYTAVPA